MKTEKVQCLVFIYHNNTVLYYRDRDIVTVTSYTTQSFNHASMSAVVLQGDGQPPAPPPSGRGRGLGPGRGLGLQPARFTKSWIQCIQQHLCKPSAQPVPEPAAPTLCLTLKLTAGRSVPRRDHKAQGLGT